VPEVADLAAAVNAFLARTPCALLEVSLDDLFGEEAPVNLPGVPPDRYPSWMRRPRMPLEALVRDLGVRRAIAGAERRTPRRTGGLPRPAARPPA
jgi:(1->4)-alpha-D-glucan 1-alpha-D-glucosylmutase